MTELHAKTGGPAGFLRENWPWIVYPIAVTVVLILALVFFFGQGAGDPYLCCYPFFG